jgi:hypothetical protein
VVTKKKTVAAARVPANIMDPAAWEIGPADYPSGNPSKGMPPHPTATPDGWAIDFGSGEAHYVTVPTGPLTGKTRVTLTGRIEMAPGVDLVPVKDPAAPALLTLFLQRVGDDWSAKGAMEAYRWWASFGTMGGLRAGEFTMSARFDQNWTAVLVSSAQSNPQGFQAALANAARIGFTLGGGDGLGHGVYATGPARLVVTGFEVV